ncbi:hypothetical protein QBZ16_005058 [Prototheca wickerhamii]|uniref:TRUD domain-containing protein n=1 Tax=Prototheca wickerhamii TaxID=3111 RepID=A0AAD9MHH5_PROWI|nr:hypothetical protein QBZ16_005058 [Prototheca wickerhamii]
MTVEEDVGITAYANAAPAFAATLKHRFSDFKVNEIREDGSLVVLADTGLPEACLAKEEQDKAPVSPETLAAEFERAAGRPPPAELLPFLLRVAQGEVIWDGAIHTERVDLGTFESKEQRSAVHGVFKQWSTLATETGPEGAIQIGLGGGRRGIKRRRGDWPGGAHRYVRFTLYKENADTQAALAALARRLGVTGRVFGFAGTKDKRGCTTQEVTAFRVDPARLRGACARLLSGGSVRLGDYRFCDDQLRLGRLGGNRFSLVLRQVPAGRLADVEDACRALQRSGFVNYFGLQRFGSGGVPTSSIGQALLAGDWAEAVRRILQQKGKGELKLPATAEEAKAMLRACPSWAVAEKHILQALIRHGVNNHLTALQAIPKTLRLMYIHAYQSLLWNHAASRRLQLSPTAVLAGDLVAADREGAALSTEREAAGDRDEDAEEENAADEEATLDLSANLECHVVTEAEAAARAYSLFDVLLPLPGGKIRYPANATAYRELAEADGLSLGSAGHGCAEFSLAGQTGAYRPLLARPGDLEWRVVRYADRDAALPPAEASEGPLAALCLDFSLRPSTYATMLVRELTKQPAAALHAPLPRQATEL